MHWFHEDGTTSSTGNSTVQALCLRFACCRRSRASDRGGVAGAGARQGTGFVGCLVNSDPFENDGSGTAPGMGDCYWYPLYEKLCELDVPCIAAWRLAGERPRHTFPTHFINEETLSVVHLLNSTVFDDFPKLRFPERHGGGAAH